MTCAVCGKGVVPVVHEFYEGSPQRPVRRWKIIAPQYFVANSTFTAMTEALCGPVCSLAWRERANPGCSDTP